MNCDISCIGLEELVKKIMKTRQKVRLFCFKLIIQMWTRLLSLVVEKGTKKWLGLVGNIFSLCTFCGVSSHGLLYYGFFSKFTMSYEVYSWGWEQVATVYWSHRLIWFCLGTFIGSTDNNTKLPKCMIFTQFRAYFILKPGTASLKPKLSASRIF